MDMLRTSPPFVTFGVLDKAVIESLSKLIRSVEGLAVTRSGKANSKTPYPTSTDLERALLSSFSKAQFIHHESLYHPRTSTRFEYDYWRPEDGIAMEIMGYRADDEIYKDILKFHVHAETKIGVVWVPRWKWVSGRRTEANFKATMKALSFAESYMAVRALVAVVYDWCEDRKDRWLLKIEE